MSIASAVALMLPVLLAVQAPAASAAAAEATCPVPLPVSQVKDGMSGYGLTVSKGTSPQRFTVKVQGVLTDGIGPGIDLILAETSSAALDKAGAIWGGMSGSPVYAKNGRLIGAVSYGFSGSSTLAGITPAQAMYDIWTRSAAPARALTVKKRIELPTALQQKITSRDLVSAQVAAQGMEILPLVHGISGLSQKRIDQINQRAEQQGSDVRLVKMAATAGQQAPAAEAVPGGNFGALDSYGTVTDGALGTTTAVCDGRALAFGHPFYSTGEDVKYAAVSANVISVVPDPVYGPYKIANVGGILGTVNQDRHAGISADLGAGPPVIPVTARSTAGAVTRTDTTYVTWPRILPDLASYHVWSSLDAARDKQAGGTSTISATIRGTADGQQWELELGNRYSDQYDAIYPTADMVSAAVSELRNNPFTPVEFTGIQVTDSVIDAYRAYTVSQILVQSDEGWVPRDPAHPLIAHPGEELVLRVRATAYQAPSTDIEIRVQVPEDTPAGDTLIYFSGGRDQWFNPEEGVTNFSELLNRMRQAPRGDVLYGHVVGEDDSEPIAFSTQIDGVIGGEIWAPLTVVE